MILPEHAQCVATTEQMTKGYCTSIAVYDRYCTSIAAMPIDSARFAATRITSRHGMHAGSLSLHLEDLLHVHLQVTVARTTISLSGSAWCQLLPGNLTDRYRAVRALNPTLGLCVRVSRACIGAHRGRTGIQGPSPIRQPLCEA
jgi:hypothetical protein